MFIEGRAFSVSHPSGVLCWSLDLPRKTDLAHCTPLGCGSGTARLYKHCTPLGCGSGTERLYKHCTPLGCGSGTERLFEHCTPPGCRYGPS